MGATRLFFDKEVDAHIQGTQKGGETAVKGNGMFFFVAYITNSFG